MSRGRGNVWDDRFRKAKAIQAEMELKKSLGELVLVDEVRDAAFKEGRMLRDAIMAVPDRLAPVIAAENDPAKCRAMIAKELRSVLEGSVSVDRK
jgi:hypothetical protein